MKPNFFILIGFIFATIINVQPVYSQSDEHLQSEEQAQPTQEEKIEISAHPTTEQVGFVVGLHLWNSFRVLIHNKNSKVLKIKAEQFVLVNADSGEQFNALTLEEAYSATPSLMGGLMPIRLEPYQKSALAPLAIKDGMILPGAKKEGVIFFSKKDFSFDAADKKFKLYFVTEAQDLLEVTMLKPLS